MPAAAQALQSGGAPKPGARVLIQGGSGGVGHFALQLAKVHFKAYVVATGGPKNQELMQVMSCAAFPASPQGQLPIAGLAEGSAHTPEHMTPSKRSTEAGWRCHACNAAHKPLTAVGPGAQELGADETVDYTKEDFAQKYKDQPFDVIVDPIGGAPSDSSG